jgi:hypothetical protein
VDAGLSRVARAKRFVDLSDYGRYAFGGGRHDNWRPRSPGTRIEQGELYLVPCPIDRIECRFGWRR